MVSAVLELHLGMTGKSVRLPRFARAGRGLLSHHARILTRNQHLFIFDFSACTDCPLLTAVMTCSMPPGYCRGM